MNRYATQTTFILIGLFVVTLLLSGCAVRKPYAAPVTAPVALAQAAAPGFSAQAYDPRWWGLFDDPVLERLEAAALAGNLDIRQAVARVEQARAIFRDVSLDQYPVAGVGASVDVREQAVPGFSNEPVRTTTYRVGFEAFWEIDLFGGIRSAARSAQAEAAEPRGVARRRPRRRGGRCRAQLFRPARIATAARGGRAQPDQPARGAPAQRRAPGCRRGRGTGRRERGRERRGRGSQHPAPARGAGGAASPARRADRRAARRSGRGSRAPRLRAAADGAAARRDRHAAAAPAGRAGRRTASRRRDGARRHCRRGPLSAGVDFGRARPAGRAREPVRPRRLTPVGGRARFELGRARTWAAHARGCAGARPRPARCWRATSRRCCGRSRRRRTRSSPTAKSRPAWSG